MPPHFTDKSLKFLKSLARNNDRDWFNERKQLYEADIKAPLLAVITALNEEFADYAPEFVRDPAKCAMRIYRDIRFSKNKDPYKTNVAAWWARQGMEKTSGAGFYFHFDPQETIIAAGVYMPEKEQLLAIRRMLLERHEEVRKAMRVKDMEPFEGLKMSRGPKGFPADSPAADLILQRQWGVSARLPAEAALDRDLVKQVGKRFKAAYPLVALLNEPLIGKAGRPLL